MKSKRKGNVFIGRRTIFRDDDEEEEEYKKEKEEEETDDEEEDEDEYYGDDDDDLGYGSHVKKVNSDNNCNNLLSTRCA